MTFSSDYGFADEFVGVCHAVIARIAPEVRVIDLAHGIRGIRWGGSVLAQSLPYAPDGVHLAVVDPGVGTARRGVIIETGAGSLLVGPDNGLLPPAADALGGAVGAVELTESWFRLEPVSTTFHGRDVFAPAAAHLALRTPLRRFGPELSAEALVRLPPVVVRVGEGELEAEVVRIDAFGNLQLSAPAGDLVSARLGRHIVVKAGSVDLRAEAVRTFADVPEGEVAVLVDASGFVSVAVNGGSAAERLGSPARVLLRRVD